MISRRVGSDAVFPGEGGVGAFAEAVSLARFRVFTNLEPDRELSPQAIDPLVRARAVGAAPDR
jgi:hypothetical protein